MKTQGYLDFHSHILPGVDDGSQSMEITKAMLEMDYAQGVRTIIATPHNYPGKAAQNNEELQVLYQEVRELAQSLHSDLTVLLGNEIFYRESIVSEIRSSHILTMNDSRYLLVEFSPHENYQRIYQGLRELVDAGYYPVVAHIERVHCLFEKEKNITELIQMGCYMQANCEDMMGSSFNRVSARLRNLLKSGMIHFLGSDCHNTDSRPPMMADCIERLYKKMSQEIVDTVVYENQKRFLAKKYI